MAEGAAGSESRRVTGREGRWIPVAPPGREVYEGVGPLFKRAARHVRQGVPGGNAAGTCLLDVAWLDDEA